MAAEDVKEHLTNEKKKKSLNGFRFRFRFIRITSDSAGGPDRVTWGR